VGVKTLKIRRKTVPEHHSGAFNEKKKALKMVIICAAVSSSNMLKIYS
jgi:hypothetical protein